MGRVILGFMLAGCFSLSVWAQTPQNQSAPQQVPAAEQKAADQSHPSESPSATPSSPATETTQFPLDKFQSFSAIENGAPVPGIDSDIHLYRSGNLMRMQGSDRAPKYYVTDLAKRQSYSVSARSCLKESAPYIRSFPFSFAVPGNKYELIPIGEATVDGHQCHVEDVIIHNVKNPHVLHFRLYEAEDLQGFPIKIEGRRERSYRWVIRYKDVRIEPQDPSLFIVPEKCASDADFKKLPAHKPKAAPAAKPQ